MSEYNAEELIELFETIRAKSRDNGATNGVWESPTPLVDWVEAYGCGDDPARWLAEPLLPDAGSVAIFAKGGTGKSLLALWLAVCLATGHRLAGAGAPVDVLYLDYEMTVGNVVERLEDMGYDDPAALARLHYASLPTLAPLDSLEGGKAVVDMAVHLGVALVVVDTFGRAVRGEEDSADTVRAWYRWTGQRLKAAGIAFLRIDHAGKDVTKGQRGSSAKNDDVDIVWEMARRGADEFVLRATKRRVSWVDEQVVLTQTNIDGVLAYHWMGETMPFLAGTKEVADLLDELGAPIDISRRKAMVMLREAGRGRGTDVVADALRHRREMARTTPQDHSRGAPQDQASGTTASPQVDHPADHPGPPFRPTHPGGVHYVVVPPGEGQSGDGEMELF